METQLSLTTLITECADAIHLSLFTEVVLKNGWFRQQMAKKF